MRARTLVKRKASSSRESDASSHERFTNLDFSGLFDFEEGAATRAAPATVRLSALHV